jgi:hypothetical protein
MLKVYLFQFTCFEIERSGVVDKGVLGKLKRVRILKDGIDLSAGDRVEERELNRKGFGECIESLAANTVRGAFNTDSASDKSNEGEGRGGVVGGSTSWQ